MEHPAQKSQTPILELSNVQMSFGGIDALKGIEHDVPEGIIQAVIGPNGAGKTTLFHCISGLLKPTAGSVLFRGKEINELVPHRIAQLGISRTFQHVALFKTMTVLENVMLGRHTRTHSGFWATGLRFPGMRSEERQIKQRAETYLDFVGLADAAHLEGGTLPLGKQKILEIRPGSGHRTTASFAG